MKNRSLDTVSTMKRLAYRAEQVAESSVEYTSDCHVYSVHFGTGDPELDGGGVRCP